MYGARLFAPSQTQADEIKMLVDSFSKDFQVQRVKVEAGPNNKNIPQSAKDTVDEPEDCYFEHHVALGLKAYMDFDDLKSKFKRYSGYLSKNALKTAPNSGEQIRFVTQRFSKIGQLEADAKLKKLIAFAKQQSIDIVRIEREYNIFDSNLQLDHGWMS